MRLFDCYLYQFEEGEDSQRYVRIRIFFMAPVINKNSSIITKKQKLNIIICIDILSLYYILVNVYFCILLIRQSHRRRIGVYSNQNYRQIKAVAIVRDHLNEENGFDLIIYTNEQKSNFYLIALSMQSKWVAVIKERFEEDTGKLYLSSEAIGDNDIPDIIEACQDVQNEIKELYLWNNKIGAKGAKHLSAANFANLTQLWLENNNIGAEGAKYLSAANFPNLTDLWLEQNNIEQPNQTYLRLLLEQKNIEKVNL